MTQKMVFRWTAVGALTLAGSAGAQSDMVGMPKDWRGTLMEGTDAVIATNEYDQPLFIASGETVARTFAPAEMTGEQLADEFKRLCIDTGLDQAKLDEAVSGSGLKWAPRTFVIPARKDSSPYPVKLWVSPQARVQIWSGDTAALKGYNTYSRWRRGATISAFRPTDIRNPACNLTVMTTNFHSPEGFLARIREHLGTDAAKVVTKPEWADGYWKIVNDDGSQTRVGYSMVSLNKPEQLLHVSIARMPAKSAK